MFGDQIEITRDGQKVGLKHIDDYGSDVDTDDLANDSDLDTSTCKSMYLTTSFARIDDHK